MPVVLVAIPIIAVLVGLFAWQASQAWDFTFGAVLQALARHVDAVALPLAFGRSINFHFLAQAIRSVDKEVRHLIGVAITATSAPLVLAIHAVTSLFRYPARELADLTADVTHTIGQLRRVIVPAMLAAKVASIWHHIAALEAHVAGLLVRPAVHIVRATTHVIRTDTRIIVKRAQALTLPKLGRFEREAEALGHRVRSLERRLTLAGLTAAVIAIASRAWPFLRCKNVHNVGKHLCSWPVKALEELLAGVVDLFLLLDLCALVGLMEKSALAVEPWIERFGSELNTLARCRSVRPARGLRLGPLELPPIAHSFGPLDGS